LEHRDKIHHIISVFIVILILITMFILLLI